MHVTISVPTLRKLISSLNPGMGHDGIHSLFLKNASDLFLSKLALLINAWYGHCCMSNDVLKGTINPTVKDTKGNITESSNYRPVMQSSCILKIVELHILEILSEKIFFNSRQFGFRRGVSTTDACYVLKEIMFEYSKCRRGGFATFVDLSKAFDSVDHFILGSKLLERDIPVDIVYFLMDYLRNQQAKVVWKNSSSHYSFIEKGVRQGGILSPFLFKLYIDSIIRDVSIMNDGCTIGITKVNILAYADDIVLLSSTMDEMNNLYQMLTSGIESHKLKINIGKTKCMQFGNNTKVTFDNEKIYLGGKEFQVVKSFKYLGHMIEENLSDVSDIDFRLNSFYASTNSVLRNFRLADTNTVLFLFNSYCKPVYGINLWSNKLTLSRAKFKAFEVAYNNTLKRILGIPLYSSNHEAADKCGQLLLKHHVAALQSRYYHRLSSSKCSIIKLNLPFLRRGFFMGYVDKLFKESYDVSVSHHDPDILAARISWVQKHEQRRIPYIIHPV